MLLKTIIFAILAVGVLAQEFTVPEVSEDKRQEVRNFVKTQCEKNGAGDKVAEIESGMKSFADCVKGLVDVNVLKNEIEEAKPNGALDEVFKKYCAKSPQLKTCLHTIVDVISPCLETSTREQLPAAKTGADELIDFVCYKDGDRIALFIAEKGPECFQERAGDIKTCAETLKASVTSVDEAKKLTLAEKCAKVDTLTQCIVTALEKCSTPTPANMAESLFRYVRKGSPCAKK